MARRERKMDTEINQRGLIEVHVLDFDQGLRMFMDVKLVRVKSAEYNLLIMEDYFPLVGSVTHGEVELLTNEEQINLGHVSGFYIHRDNQFSLLVENYHDDNEKVETKEGQGHES